MDVVLNQEKMKSLLQHFYRMTGIRIGVCDPYYRMVCVVPEEIHPFCRQIRCAPERDIHCQQCDIRAFQKCRSSRLEIYRCHAGLIEAAAPIYGDGKLLGYLMIGQFLDDSSLSAQWEQTCTSLSLSKEEQQAFYPSFCSLSRLSPDYIRSAAEIMKACTSAIYLENLLSARQDSFASQAVRCVDEHLTEDLSLPFLCRCLGVGKTTLCANIREELGLTPNQLIRSRRLSAARKLLLSTSLPVTQVAERSGFADYNYFIRVFRMDCGMTPLAFRKQYQSPGAALSIEFP